MPRLSIELVPRDVATLTRELQLVREIVPSIETINIPDLLQFPLRSWEGCKLAQEYFPQTIPHLRAIDYNLARPLTIVDTLREAGIREVLVISGDPPQDMTRRVYRTSATDLIRALRKELPQLRIHAGLDPYRSSIRDELDYVKLKLDAGADGFFTQPFFDLRFMGVYQDLLQGLEVYWGICPVTSERSRDYWENRNNAFFPPTFRPDLEWNRAFAAEALDFAAKSGGNIYFMPIRADLRAYLGGLI